ncbi:MAG: helix-turn-helix domain-containing protein [Clostridia bacterium]|nr:helix-turn-helix domain-containing protein [Clostridia bacterium]
MELGRKIAEIRSSRGMSQQTLADELFVSRDLVSKWETGRRRPDYPALERIAAVLGISPDVLIDRDDAVFGELSECVPEGIAVSEEELTRLTSGFLAGLRREERDVFLARYYRLHPLPRIASEFGKKENHIRSMLSKTRKKLKKHILKAKGDERREQRE